MSDPAAVSTVEAALSNPWITGPGFLAGVAWIGAMFWKKFSNDGLEVTRNRAETDVMSVLQAENIKERDRADDERSRADRAVEERDRAIAKLSDSNIQIAALTNEVHALRDQVNGLKEDLRWLREQWGVGVRTPADSAARQVAQSAADAAAVVATAAQVAAAQLP